MVGRRRRRRRRRALSRQLGPALVLIAAAAAVAVLVAATALRISPASGSYRRTLDRGYAALVGPLVAQSNASAGDLVQLLQKGPDLDRAAFFADLDELAASSRALGRQFEAITPPDPVGDAGSDCARAMQGRARASADLRSALEGVLGGRSGTGPGSGDEAAAVGAMRSVGPSLQSDDGLWAACRSALSRAAGSARLAASTWIKDPSLWSPDALTDFVASVIGAPTLAADHHLVIANVVTVPSPSPSSGAGTILVPATTELSVHVLLENQGNVDEEGVHLVASLVTSGTQAGARLPGVSSVSVPKATSTVVAGTSAALAFPSLTVAPGDSYALSIVATTPTTRPNPVTTSVPVTIDKAVAVVSVFSSSSAVTVGRTVTYTAEVFASLPGLPAATGTVTFDDDGSPIPSCARQPVGDAQATCSVSYDAADMHAITALYSGDPSRSASTSAPLIEKVTGAAPGPRAISGKQTRIVNGV
jgi:hypothetical protein